MGYSNTQPKDILHNRLRAGGPVLYPQRFKANALTGLKAGEPLILKPGQSICLKSIVYHRFYGQKGKGSVLIGEVSLVNDDANDNRFYDKIGRFHEIVEDVKPVHLLVNDYVKYL